MNSHENSVNNSNSISTNSKKMRLEPVNKVNVVLGAQWGDEGKGKLVDLLATEADVVCRCAVSRNKKDFICNCMQTVEQCIKSVACWQTSTISVKQTGLTTCVYSSSEYDVEYNNLDASSESSYRDFDP